LRSLSRHIAARRLAARHQLKWCSCYIPGASETDPPELTKRQAARLAVELWEEEHDKNGASGELPVGGRRPRRRWSQGWW